MKYVDVVATGGSDTPAGMPTGFPLKGFRIIPILIAGATIADVIAAYAPLVVTMLRSSNARAISGIAPVGITDVIAVPGPDWIRSPGFSAMTLVGQGGTTYRVFWSEDCYEVMDPGTSPMLNGFAGAAASIASPLRANIGPAGAGTQTSASAAANKPSSATDGLAVSAGHRGAYATVSAAVGQTISAIGAGASDGLVWWKYNSAIARWSETLLVEQIQIGARDAAGLEQMLATCNPGDRVYAEARNITVSAGAITVSLSVS